MRQNAAASNLPQAVAAATIAYDAANELTRWNSATTNLTYDANGNLAIETQGGVTTTYTWDSRNRVTGLNRTGLTASFGYDGLGRRKSKTINGTTTGFWYDGSDVYAELTGTTPSATCIRGLSLDEPYIRKGATDEFYETDALGSSVALTNAAGASQTTYTYEPFGNTTQTGTASPNASQYMGRENDGIGLYYYRARYYSPRTQRFVSEDPIEFRGGDFNLYAYVLNNPIGFTDPEGMVLYVSPDLGGPKGPMGQLYKSKRGRELIKELKQSDKIFYIVSSPGSRQLRRIEETTIVQIDPNYHPDLCTTQGILPIETSIAIAHEMGHLIGAHDDGPGSMANILKNENPVRRDLGIPLRTQYDPPHVRRSNKYIYSIFSWTGLILSLLLTSEMSAGEQDKFREKAIDSGMSSSRYRSDDHHSTVLHFLPFGTETVMGITPQAIEEHSDYILRFSKIWPMESPFPRYEEHTFVKFLRTIFTSKTTTQRINTSFIRLKVKFPDATFYVDDTGVVWREDTRQYFQLTNEQMKDIATRMTGYAGVIDLKMNEKK